MRSEFVFWWSGGRRDQRLLLTSILGACVAFSRIQLGLVGFMDLFKCWTLVTFLSPREEFFVVLFRVSAVIQQTFSIIISLSFHVVGDVHIFFSLVFFR